jgi:hypothetical protein
MLQVTGRKPEWEVGAQQAIKRKKAVMPAAPAPAPAASIWSSINADDSDLLDDDELLTEEDLVRPVNPGAQHWKRGHLRCVEEAYIHCVHCVRSMLHVD